MISIIVPVYNAQKYIKRCVESIVNQTYKDWELFLIDDGSKDESGTICNQLAKSDSRIQVFHTENQGASAARNRGLDEATGEYVTFVDADDWIETNHLQVLIDQVLPDVDLCINSFIADLYYGARPHHYEDIQTCNNVESITVFFTILLLHSQFLWNKLFRNNIIKANNIRFDTNVSLGEDNIFILEYLNYIKGLSSSSVCTYHYDQVEENPFSLGRRKRSEDVIVYQLKRNFDAIFKLYEKYKMDLLYNYASNYYYTRIFERVLVPSVKKKHGVANVPKDLSKYFADIPKLTTEFVENKWIRCFWKEVEYENKIRAKYIFNFYLLKQWLKSRIIQNVVTVKHVFKNVQRNVSV